MRRVGRFASAGRAERIGRGNRWLLAQPLPVLDPAPSFGYLAAAALLAGLLIGVAEALPALFMGAAAILLPANLVMPLPRSAPLDPIQITLAAVVVLSFQTAASAAFGLCV